jgi:hypothetical protein
MGTWKAREENKQEGCLSMLVSIVTVGLFLLSYHLAQTDSSNCGFFFFLYWEKEEISLCGTVYTLLLHHL